MMKYPGRVFIMIACGWASIIGSLQLGLASPDRHCTGSHLSQNLEEGHYHG